MRKVLLISEIFPPVHGGSGRWFWEIYRRFPVGTIEVLTNDVSGGSDTDKGFPHPVHRLAGMAAPSWGVRSLEGLKYYYRLWKKLDALVREGEIAQVHCGRVIPEGMPALFNKFRRGVPYTCYVHGEDVEVARTSREITLLTRLVLRHAERIVANSENTANILRKWWDIQDHRLIVMTPGVDVERFVPTDSTRPDHWSGQSVILTVGRLQQRKGQDMMIQALPVIREAIPNVLYCVVGGGAEEGRLRELTASLGITDHVEFAGEMTDDQMLACYQGCDLFALPNRRVHNDDEGFGMVLLEAQSCGKPVLAGNAGGTRETLTEETGVIVDCTSPEPLASAVIELLQDDKRLGRMGLAGREHAAQRFSWKGLAEQAMARLA
ncbi:glycosyltransferase family 4 protein [Marinobacter lacisalsi]|uniref:Glycosyltransferase family 4 protein n=1 Tax=Marinobacter lacisalsi TaxID=475979 RepID=A0ABV8QET9_9GAMM